MPNSLQPDVGLSYLHTTFHPQKNKIVWRWALHQIRVFYMINIKKRRKVSCVDPKHFFEPLLGIIILRGLLAVASLKTHKKNFPGLFSLMTLVDHKQKVAKICSQFMKKVHIINLLTVMYSHGYKNQEQQTHLSRTLHSI